MHILLVNDDGFDSPYLPLLATAASRRGHRVSVSAPDTQQSGKAHSFTVFTPLMVTPSAMEGAAEAWRVQGTPVDCARLGLMALCQEPVDLVISGINDGYNAGLATFLSGTVGAAREAAFSGHKALAVSIEAMADPRTAQLLADYAIRTAEKLMDYPLPPQTVCNLNMPPVAPEQLKAPVVAPLNHDYYDDSYEQRVSPRGVTYFWLTFEKPLDHYAEGTDRWYLEKGHPTVTFLGTEPMEQGKFADFPLPLK